MLTIRGFSVISCFFFVVLFLGMKSTGWCQSSADPSASWIWYPESPQDNSVRYFRYETTLSEKPRRVTLYVSCDDGGRFFINGNFAKDQLSLKSNFYDVTGLFSAGRNVLAFEIGNGRSLAGLIVKGEIVNADGSVESIETNKDWKVSNRLFPGWNSLDFDDRGWSSVAVLGAPDMEPWKKHFDYSVFLPRTEAALLSRFVPIPASKKGILMVEDFSTISTWMGEPIKGHDPAASNFPFGMGSIPRAERDDGFAGAIEYGFVEPGGQIRFEKNQVYQLEVMPEAILFDANAMGNASRIWFEFTDKRKTSVFASKKVRLDGSGWRNHRLELNRNTINNYDNIMFPISIRRIFVEIDNPGNGMILLDDIAYEADVSSPESQLSIRPEYDSIAHLPGTDLTQGYRIRNALPRSVNVDLSLKVYGIDGELLSTLSRKIRLNKFELGKVRFDLGKFQTKGAYRLELTANNGQVSTTSLGWIGVFIPNGKRINREPMWFGIEDQELHTFHYEASLHLEWMKLLGCDLLRAGTLGGRLEPVRGATTGYDAFRESWKPYFDAGLDIMFYYAARVPSWTMSEEYKKRNANWRSGMSDIPYLLEEHIENVSKFMAEYPQIKYFEWMNEPDLSGFTGTTEEYIESLKLIYPIIKENSPDVKVTTGGMVVPHVPSSKKDFTRRVYQEGAGSYDIASYHGHDNFGGYKELTMRMMGWLDDENIKTPIGNSEAGARSYYTVPSVFTAQASELVQKMTYTKSVGAEFYIWFMLQDYWDKYINADDSFGLVTVDNQPKPSFIAYNELVRQLSNSSPVDAPAISQDLESYCFRSSTDDVYVCWPKRGGAGASIYVKSEAPISVYDIYGNEQRFYPVRGVVGFKSHATPFYIRGKTGQIGAVDSLLEVVGNDTIASGEDLDLAVDLINPYGQPARYTLSVNGYNVAGNIPVDGRQRLSIPIKPFESDLPGPKMLTVSLKLVQVSGESLFDGDVSVLYQVALSVPPAARNENEGHSIVMDTVDKVTELAFDPLTPRWDGPEDLSATIDISWGELGLVFHCVVVDSDHSVPFHGIDIWRNDCIQVAIGDSSGINSEITVSGDDDNGSSVWCHIAQDESLLGQWDIQSSVVRKGDRTVYDFVIPFDKIGLQGHAGEIFNMAILVCDNDGGRRLRIMEWNHGIEGGKDHRLLGRVKLR